MKNKSYINNIILQAKKQHIGYEKDSSILLLNTNGRKINFIKDKSIDAIVTDFPWKDEKAHQGTNQKNMVEEYKHETFLYDKEDIEEKYRILKDGAYCVEFFPQLSITNIEWMIEIINIFLQSGFIFQASVDWVKGKSIRISKNEFKNNSKVFEEFKEVYLGQEKYFNGEDFYLDDNIYELIKSSKQNQGKKIKDGDQIFFFTKGKARNLKIDYSKIKNILSVYATNGNLYKDLYNEVFEENIEEFRDKGFAFKKVNDEFSGKSSIEIKGKQYKEFKKRFIEESKIRDLKTSYCQSGTKYIIPARLIVPQVNKKIHDSEKPIELYKKILELVTKQNEIILDQFSGSGNLGIACRELKRKSILVEVDEKIFVKSKQNLFGIN